MNSSLNLVLHIMAPIASKLVKKAFTIHGAIQTGTGGLLNKGGWSRSRWCGDGRGKIWRDRRDRIAFVIRQGAGFCDPASANRSFATPSFVQRFLVLWAGGL
jgi:hypothetical protein